MIRAVLLAVVVGLLPAALPSAAATPDVERAVLTSAGCKYRYHQTGERLVTRATRCGKEPNRRELLVASGARAGRDQMSCATWAKKTGWRIQPGLAVRVVERGGRVRAVTLTKNIVFGMQSVMNVATWDTARRGEPWRKVGQYDLARGLLKNGRLRPLPWRACLRVEGRRLSFKVWPLGRVDRVPRWGDRRYARNLRLPSAFDVPGRPGWYVGHVPSGGRLVYRNLTTD